ncbi:hypothetical protein [Geodermatophilus sp. CPCC 205761]|uniref:hypothetical protein n=1 Tax=Geodermatophilus sp. CPCC 205761 TaxID=2936597 RepID=UPI003EED4E98
MTEARRDPETGGRPLADILREAGVESPRGRRRRGDDDHDTGVRQRGAGGDRTERGERSSDTGRVAERGAFGRRSTDRTGDLAPPTPERRRPRAADPSTAAIPGLRPSRKPGVPSATTATTGVVGTPARAKATDEAPSTGPIPVVRADADAPLLDDGAVGGREGALAWLRFAGELVVALAAGVGIYFLFTVLWELLPYLAVLLAPLAVAGLVAGVAAWRQRQDKEAAGVRLVGILVFAGTLLTIAPAASLLSGT